ncbi:TatD family hydrolase [Actinosynnema sp. NPDC047251]|uniref:Putative deoxyribonuclease n=1 Tax=Saccharothrix espanaensis (strain ATCC 51144 / DSM 44229 / JCM 9112 / NBRC 15066 / NRRL 15764) TaxID=1179773 RepID=K0JQR3_SACES|nr:TatD family hydrolase [Saccharothrix espanaensis]CCH28026.1 putative deoxyribonuclease [Saccharothrix espanaensis DSM 44229]
MTKRRGERPPVPEALPVPVVDAHTHLDACGAQTPEQVREILDRANAAGVDRVITVADDLASARWAAQAATWDERVFAAVALHPTRTSTFTDADRAELTALAARPRVVAIGETGLDYYWDYSPPAAQHDAFRWHIELSKLSGKTLMIHDRDAHDDVLKVLDEEGAPSTVVFHCFSGDLDFARACVERGFVLSFAGAVTFRNAGALREAAAWVPADHLLVETDAPFLTPHPFRGRPNEPYCANYTLRDIATLRDVDVADLASTVTRNAERVFNLGDVVQSQ